MMEMKKDFAACAFDLVEDVDELRQFIARIQKSAETLLEWESIKERIDNNPDLTISQLRKEIPRHISSVVLRDKWLKINEDVERMIPYIWCDQNGRTTKAMMMVRMQEMILFAWAKEYYARIPEHDKIEISKLVIRDTEKRELLLRIQTLMRRGQWQAPASKNKITYFFCIILGVAGKLATGHDELPNKVLEYLTTDIEDEKAKNIKFESAICRFLGLFMKKGYFQLSSGEGAVQISDMIFGEAHKKMNLEIGKGYRKDEDRFRKICEMAECYLPKA